MLAESVIRVSADPHVELFVAQTAGPAGRVLLVIHGGPDWDHSYLREPLVRLAGSRRVVFADLRGCGRSTRGLASGQYTPDAAITDLLALLDSLRVNQADVLGFSASMVCGFPPTGPGRSWPGCCPRRGRRTPWPAWQPCASRSCWCMAGGT